jgi:Carbohydrate binding module (family 6)
MRVLVRFWHSLFEEPGVQRRSRWKAALVLAAGTMVLASVPSVALAAAEPTGAPATGPVRAPADAAIGAPVRYQAEDGRIFRGKVEANHPGFDGRGFVNYAGRGSYVEFTVQAPTSGWALLTIRFANGSRAERSVAVLVNGESQGSDLVFGPTGSWRTWQDSTSTPLLAAGVNKIRLIASTSRGGPNLDWLESHVTEPTADFQAEDALISQGVVESRHRGFTGRGYVNPTNVAGGFVEWTVSSPARLPTNMFWRFANGTDQDRTTTLTINGEVVTDEWLFRSSGASWSQWQTAGLTVWLDAGANRIRLTANTADGGPNYDKLIVGIRS